VVLKSIHSAADFSQSLLIYSATGRITIGEESPQISLCEKTNKGIALTLISNKEKKFGSLSFNQQGISGCPVTLKEKLWPKQKLLAWTIP